MHKSLPVPRRYIFYDEVDENVGMLWWFSAWIITPLPRLGPRPALERSYLRVCAFSPSTRLRKHFQRPREAAEAHAPANLQNAAGADISSCCRVCLHAHSRSTSSAPRPGTKARRPQWVSWAPQSHHPLAPCQHTLLPHSYTVRMQYCRSRT